MDIYIPKLLWGFMSLSTIFKPYEDNQRVNMQDSVQAVLLRFSRNLVQARFEPDKSMIQSLEH